MKLKCLFGHAWGEPFAWSTWCAMPPPAGDFMAMECKRCGKLMELPNTRTKPGQRYVDKR